jgi:hypothetical protein
VAPTGPKKWYRSIRPTTPKRRRSIRGCFGRSDRRAQRQIEGYVCVRPPVYQAGPNALRPLGKKDEARKLAMANAAKMKPLPADEQNPLAASDSENDLILWLAYKKAKAMIHFDSAPAAPTPNDRK